MPTIVDIKGFEILDSRGNPTIHVNVQLSDGSIGSASVPSGASTGNKEAHELRDADAKRYHGKGVLKAVAAVNGELKDALIGLDALAQTNIDHVMIELDGTEYKSRLGANATLGVSLAVAKAAAKSTSLPLYRYVGGVGARLLPAAGMNIINGGVHAHNPIDFQEFMIMPLGSKSFSEHLRAGSEVFHVLKRKLTDAGFETNVGDEGGFAPALRNAEEALDFIVSAIESTGYKPGKDVSIVLDPACSEFYEDGAYHYTGEGLVRSVAEHVDYLEKLCATYPIVSIEDPMAEDDFEGWNMITDRIGKRVQLTGDDVFCTNVKLLEHGVINGYANSILIKVNQIGTLTEALDAVEAAHKAGYTVVMSHRSGETEDTTVADLAVATNCGQIKTGSLSRSDRTAKYNRLLMIEAELGEEAMFLGHETFKRFRG